MSIVIIDDSVSNLIVLKRMAASTTAASEIHTFSSPEDAYAYLNTNTTALIIVDCEMPVVNGIELIAAVRRLEKHGKTPILMVTQHNDAELRRQALNAGATAFLSKPVNALEFRILIQGLLPVQAA